MKKRIEGLDALRGFALFGILVANMLHFQYGNITFDSIQPDTWWDKFAFYFTKIAVEGSFYPIFGFMFGYGIIQFVRSLENRELKTRGPLWRRAIGLMVLGGLHIALIWDGDILLTYGSGLLIFMLFIKRKVRTLLIWASILILIFIPLGALKTGMLSQLLPSTTELTEIYSSGTYWEVVQYRIGNFEEFTGFMLLLLAIFIPIILGFISIFSFVIVGPFVLLGMASGKVNLFAAIEGNTNRFKQLSLLVPLGLVLKSMLYWDHFIGQALYTAGTYVLAIGYIALFMWVFNLMKERRVTKSFANLGRMSLTNYLMQSVICTMIFYGYGLGMFGQLGVALGVALAIVIFILQLMLANWYAKRFAIGPVEWVLRKFVYL